MTWTVEPLIEAKRDFQVLGGLTVLAQGEVYTADRLADSGLHLGLILEPTVELCRGAIDHGAHRQLGVSGIEIMRRPGQQAPGQKLVYESSA